MNLFHFNHLELKPTKDIRSIKRAYAMKAKTVHPEESPEEFKNLRSAYEQCLAYAKNPNVFIVEGPSLVYRYEGLREPIQDQPNISDLVEVEIEPEESLRDRLKNTEGVLDFQSVLHLSQVEHEPDVIIDTIKTGIKGNDGDINETLKAFLQHTMKQVWILNETKIALAFVKCLWWVVENKDINSDTQLEIKQWLVYVSDQYPQDSQIGITASVCQQRLEVQKHNTIDETVASLKKKISRAIEDATRKPGFDLNGPFVSYSLKMWLSANSELTMTFLVALHRFVNVVELKRSIGTYRGSIEILIEALTNIIEDHDSETTIVNKATLLKEQLEVLHTTSALQSKGKPTVNQTKKPQVGKGLGLTFVSVVLSMVLLMINRGWPNEDKKKVEPPPITINTDYLGQTIQMSLTSSETMDNLRAILLTSCLTDKDYEKCSSFVDEVLFERALQLYEIEPFEIQGIYRENTRNILLGNAEDYFVEVLMGERTSQYTDIITRAYTLEDDFDTLKEFVSGWREEDIRAYLEALVNEQYPPFEAYLDRLE